MAARMPENLYLTDYGTVRLRDGQLVEVADEETQRLAREQWERCCLLLWRRFKADDTTAQ
jgi:hypothetical protein